MLACLGLLAWLGYEYHRSVASTMEPEVLSDAQAATDLLTLECLQSVAH